MRSSSTMDFREQKVQDKEKRSDTKLPFGYSEKVGPRKKTITSNSNSFKNFFLCEY